MPVNEVEKTNCIFANKKNCIIFRHRKWGCSPNYFLFLVICTCAVDFFVRLKLYCAVILIKSVIPFFLGFCCLICDKHPMRNSEKVFCCSLSRSTFAK